MGVNFPGGPAGDGPKGGKKYSAPTPSSGVSQPVVITTTNGPIGVNLPVCKSTSPESSRGEAKMPTGGTNPTS
jgi:hypothetical protein